MIDPMLIQVTPGRYRRATAAEIKAANALRQKSMATQLPTHKTISLPFCRHEGKILDRLGSNCPKCWIRECDLYQRCTTQQPTAGLACCVNCLSHQADNEQEDRPLQTFTRHLLFHLYPRKNSNWRWHANKLLEFAPLFNGRKIVAIVSDGTTDSINFVKDALHDVNCEILTLPNNPTLREVATFEPLFSRLSDSIGREDVTLYAHGKGSTNHTWPDRGKTIQLWTETLYEIMCDYWPVVSNILQTRPVAGCFLRRGKYWQESTSTWHYSGSWFWFRNRDLFNKDWRRIDKFWSGIEPYPSQHFSQDEAGIVFGDLPIPGEPSWPYRPEVWQDTLLPMLVQWREQNQSRRWQRPT